VLEAYGSGSPRREQSQTLLSLLPMAVQSFYYVILQVYCQTVTITNPSKATVEATLRAGSSDRYTISPTKLVLRPHQSIDIDVRLRILRYAQKQKAVQQGQRDIFHIKVCKSY